MSKIADGTMFVKMPSRFTYTTITFENGKEVKEEHSIWENDNTAKVYVKVGELEGREGYSRFVDNTALALFGATGKPISFTDIWGVSDNFFESNVANGNFVVIEDLREVEGICKERGVNPPPPIDLDGEFGIAE